MSNSKQVMVVKPGEDPEIIQLTGWMKKISWGIKTYRFKKFMLYGTYDTTVFLLLPERARINELRSTTYAVKLEKGSKRSFLPISEFDRAAVAEILFFHRSLGEIEKIFREEIINFTPSVLEILLDMATRFSRLDAGISEAVRPQRFIESTLMHIASYITNSRYFKVMETIYGYLDKGGDAAVVAAQIEEILDEPGETGLFDVSNRVFAFRLGKFDCYMRSSGICSLDLTEDQYAAASAAEIEQGKKMMDEDSVHYCVRFRNHILREGVENIAPARMLEFEMCGHTSFSDGQHRACIAKRSGHLLHATNIKQKNCLCGICSMRRSGSEVGSNEFVDEELLHSR